MGFDSLESEKLQIVDAVLFFEVVECLVDHILKSRQQDALEELWDGQDLGRGHLRCLDH